MELAPEKLIEMLEKGESLPNIILMYGEENYYRSKAAACIKKYVFGSAADEDMEIARRMKIWKSAFLTAIRI